MKKIHFNKNTKDKLNYAEIFFCFAMFAYYVLWAIAKQYNYAPDEAMRYSVTKFFFDNNHLPVGDELLSHWGFSYAHYPTLLCHQLGYVFMKIAAIINQSDFFLLIAARMVSVCCATGAVYFLIKITKRLFLSPARWIAIVSFAVMPQYCFLASYVNNDIIIVLGTTMIVYAWVLAIKDNWNVKNSLLLAVGVSICALSYYNSYGYILFSVLMVAITYFHKHKGDFKGFMRLALGMSAVVLILISYNFIRHLVLYGDLLGFKTVEYYGEMYAIESLKPSVKLSFFEQGIGFFDMLFAPYEWVQTTFMSFIGMFGYMQFACPTYVYKVVFVFFAIGAVGLLISGVIAIKEKLKPQFEIAMFYISLVLCSIFTIGLSLYNSYFSDFQPQGRYCYPMYIALMLIIAKGYEHIIKLIPNKYCKCVLNSAICIAWILGSVFIYKTAYLPT